MSSLVAHKCKCAAADVALAVPGKQSQQSCSMRQNWYREREPDCDEHPVNVEVNRCLDELPEYRDLRRKVLDPGGLLTRQLEDDQRELWLDLEAAMNDRWAIATEEYFNAGFEQGMSQRIVDDVLTSAGIDARLAPASAVRALAAALADLAARIG